MTDEQLKLIQDLIEGAVAKAVPDAVEPAIKKYVNGKIDRLSETLDTHISTHQADMDTIRPFIQGVAGAKVLGSGLKWIAGIAIAYLTVKSFLTGSPL